MTLKLSRFTAKGNLSASGFAISRLNDGDSVLFQYPSLAGAYAPGTVLAKARRMPAAALRAYERANRALAARQEPRRPLMSAMLESWRQTALEFAAAPSRKHFIRLARPGEAYAQLAAICTSKAGWGGGHVFESLVMPVPAEALPALQADPGEQVAAEWWERANRSPRRESRALILMTNGRAEIMGLRVERPLAEPDPVDVVRHWWRPDGPGDRVDPAWLERAAIAASGVAQ